MGSWGEVWGNKKEYLEKETFRTLAKESEMTKIENWKGKRSRFERKPTVIMKDGKPRKRENREIAITSFHIHNSYFWIHMQTQRKDQRGFQF